MNLTKLSTDLTRITNSKEIISSTLTNAEYIRFGLIPAVVVSMAVLEVGVDVTTSTVLTASGMKRRRSLRDFSG